jgi:VIT1/CCC1 family predicted Fe2+/Mn2+ transporter
MPLRSSARLEQQHGEHEHRNITSGGPRAAVFGVSDGLVTNVSLIMGVAGAGASASFVRLAGLAGLVGGAISMAAGEYISMQAQRELMERELAVEREALRHSPEAEAAELTEVYVQRGIAPETARRMADEVSRDPEVALETHAREELGVSPRALGSPWIAAGTSLVTFALGAFLPLIPWFFMSGTAAIVTTIVIGAVAAFLVGALLGVFTERSVFRSAVRQLAIAIVAAGVTYGIGKAVGVSAA